MATTEQVTEAVRLARESGVQFLKIEFEATVDPVDYPGVEGLTCPEPSCHEGRSPLPCKVCCGSGEWEDQQCESCDGTGDSAEIDGCRVCDGFGRVSDPDAEVEDYLWHFEATYREIVSQECAHAGLSFDDVVRFLGVFLDASAGTEATITVPVENAHLLPQIIDGFVRTAAVYGNDIASDPQAIERAGMHMTLLWSGTYPSNVCLPTNRLQTFKASIDRLKLALMFLGSVGGRTRSLDFRDINTTGRGLIDYHHDTCIEFRSFDPCYVSPGQLLDNFLTIVQTLQFFRVELEPGYWNIAPSWFRGRYDRWGWFSLPECFASTDLRDRLRSELVFFSAGDLATEKAKHGSAEVNSWD